MQKGSSMHHSVTWTHAARTKTNRLLSVLLVIALLLPSWSQSNPAGAQVDKLHPALREIANEGGQQPLRVIVQVDGAIDDIAQGDLWHGGMVYHNLSMLNALAVEIPADKLVALSKDQRVRRVSPDAVVLQSAEADGDLIAQEEFNGSAADMERSVNWRWQELGETDGFDLGDVALVRFLAGTMEGLRIQGGNRGAQATVQLSAQGNLSLTMGYRRKDFNAGSDVVTLAVSADQGASWQQIAAFGGPVGDPVLNVESFELADVQSDQVMLRILSDAGTAATAGFYIDFIRIESKVTPEELPHQIHLPLVVDNINAKAAEVDAQNSSSYVLDRFDSVSYNNNHGTASWASSWQENDPYGSPGPNGEHYVGIVNGRLVINMADKYTERIERSVNLSGAQSAILSFDWQTVGLDSNETLSVQIRNSQVGYQTLAEFGGNQQGKFSQDISSFIDGSVKIRFANRSSDWEWGEKVFIDNVKIEWWNTPSTITPTPTPPGMINTSNLASTYVKAIEADQVWNEATPKRGSSVTVAVVDSGIAPHWDLNDANGNSRILVHAGFLNGQNYEFPAQSFDSYFLWFLETSGITIDDFYGHGTHVAGTIAGNGQRSNGAYMGVAPETKLIDMKVINDHGVGMTSDVVAGLQWIHENAALYNIRVVNMSLNSTVAESYLDNPLSTAVEILWFNGITVVVSVGNNGDNDDNNIIYPPANDPFVISVGATEDQGTVTITDDPIAPYSVRGITEDGFAKPEIVVPGTDIIAALSGADSNLAIAHPAHMLGGENGKHYFRMSGTSMAAAVATGAVALLLDAEPSLTPDQVKYRLMSTGTAFGEELIRKTAAPVDDGLVALYLFDEGTGSIVYDASGVGTPHNLTIQDPTNVTWFDGGLSVDFDTIIQGSVAPAKLYDACQANSELTVETWVAPAFEYQDGPARIVTASANINQRNFTLGQEWDEYIGRLRTSSAGDTNGMPELGSGEDYLISPTLMHVVYTHQQNGNEYFFLDGVQVKEQHRQGSFSNWDRTYRLALANEFSMDRPWLGELHKVAIYCKALSPDTIYDNYVAGPEAASAQSVYLNIREAIHGSSLEAANQGIMPNMLLAKMAMMAYWASQNGDESIDWSSVNWNSVNWNSVNWNSVNWNSVNWNSVNWNSVNWNSVNWNSVNWNSVNWNSVNWNSVNWNSVNWNSVNWNSVNWNSVDWD
ncbi:S8 family serine peptidase [bacterium]|nr:S8 family serine peptidase [bacterium]